MTRRDPLSAYAAALTAGLTPALWAALGAELLLESTGLELLAYGLDDLDRAACAAWFRGQARRCARAAADCRARAAALAGAS